MGRVLLKKVAENRGGYVIWDVGDEFVWFCGENGFEGIAFFQFKFGVVAECCFQVRDYVPVQFNGVNLFGVFEKFIGEDSQSGANFNYVVCWF